MAMAMVLWLSSETVEREREGTLVPAWRQGMCPCLVGACPRGLSVCKWAENEELLPPLCRMEPVGGFGRQGLRFMLQELPQKVKVGGDHTPPLVIVIKDLLWVELLSLHEVSHALWAGRA